MKNEFIKYKILFTVILILFSGILLYLYLAGIKRDDSTIEKIALEQAKAGFYKDLLYRKWASQKGGVYVPLTDSTQPNPYLQVKDREIISTKGDQYTLINPAYMTRQANKLAQELYEIKGHITSLKPINPLNEPDDWEKKALMKFDEGLLEYYSKDTINGELYLRYIGAMKTEKSCLKCHEIQGYKEGDIRGGICISVPLKKYESISKSEKAQHRNTFLSIFLIAIIILFIAYRILSNEIKKRIYLQQKQLENAEKHKRIIQYAINGFILTDKNGKILEVNHSYCKMSGYTEDELLKMNISNLETPENKGQNKQYIENVQQNKSEKFESVHKRKDGTSFNVEISMFLEPFSNNRIAEFVEDITERKNTLIKLLESETKFRLITENIQDVVWIFDPEKMHFSYVSPSVEKMQGFTHEEFLLMPINNLMPPHSQSKLLELVTERYARFKETEIQEVSVDEFDLIHKNGIIFHAEIISFFRKNSKTGNIEAIGTTRDITRRKNNEEALKKTEKRFFLAMQAASDGLFDWNIETNEIYYSPGWKKMLGYEDSELKNKTSTWRNLMAPEDFEETRHKLNKHLAVKQNKFEAEFKMSHKNGHWVHMLLRANIIYNSKEQVIRLVGTHSDITDRKNWEKNLIENEKQLQLIFDNSPAVMLLLNKKGEIVKINQTGLKFTKTEFVDEILNKKGGDAFRCIYALRSLKGCGFHIKCERCKIRATILDTINNGKPNFRVDADLITHIDKKIKKKHVLVSCVKATEYPENTYLVTIDDITLKKIAERALQEERDKAEKYLDIAGVIILVLNIDSKVNLINQTGCNILGYNHEEIINKDWTNNFIPKERRSAVKQILDGLMSGEIERYQYAENMIITKNGELRNIAWHNTILKDDRGTIIGALSSGEDITERIKAEKELKEKNAFIQTVLDNLPIGIALNELNNGYTSYINKKFSEIYGWPKEELLCVETFFENVYPNEKYREELINKVMTDINSGKPERMHWENIIATQKNGNKKVINAVNIPLTDQNTIVSTVIDITAQKQAENELIKAKEKAEESEEKYRNLVETAQELIWKCDNKGKFVYLNNAWEKTHGYKIDEMLGKTFKNFQKEDVYIRDTSEFSKQLFNGSIKGYETTHINKNGNEITLLLNVIPVLDSDGNIIGTQGTATDITERKKYEEELEKHRNQLEKLVKERTDELEVSYKELIKANKELYKQKNTLESTLKKLHQTQNQLIQSEKMASLGVLVAGVAHEINNPVNFINSSLLGLKNNMEFLSDYANLYNQIADNTEEVISQIKEKEKEATLSEVMGMLKRSIEIIEVGIERTTKIVNGLKSFARSDEKKIEKYNIHESIENTLLILYNQYKNKVSIIKQYAKLPEIECFPGQINQVMMNLIFNAIQAIEEKGKIIIKTTVLSNNKIQIQIRDTGNGIKEDEMKHIFDPFFTTKEVGKGTGLGLSISYGIIKDHQGEILVKSKIGKGSSFIVKLPIVQ